MLGLVVTDALYRAYPEVSEGRLAKLRASVVNMRALARVAGSIGTGGLGAWLRLGHGEEATGGRAKPSLLADTLEALLGAVYLTGGLEEVAAVIRRLFDPLMAQAGRLGAGLDWKTSLQELAATRLLGPVEYKIAASGPDHAKRFTATAVVAGVASGSGEGRSKKEAELRAAEAAFTELQDRAPDAPAPDVPAPDVPGPDVPGPDVPGPDVPGHAWPGRPGGRRRKPEPGAGSRDPTLPELPEVEVVRRGLDRESWGGSSRGSRSPTFGRCAGTCWASGTSRRPYPAGGCWPRAGAASTCGCPSTTIAPWSRTWA